MCVHACVFEPILSRVVSQLVLLCLVFVLSLTLTLTLPLRHNNIIRYNAMQSIYLRTRNKQHDITQHNTIFLHTTQMPIRTGTPRNNFESSTRRTRPCWIQRSDESTTFRCTTTAIPQTHQILSLKRWKTIFTPRRFRNNIKDPPPAGTLLLVRSVTKNRNPSSWHPMNTSTGHS